MEVLLSAASYFFTDNIPYGEGLICYNFVKHLPYITFHVISPNINVNNIPENVKLYETKGYNNPFKSSLFKAINFGLRSFSISKSILNSEDIDIIHHFLPVQYPRIVSFLSLDRSIMEKYPFIVGPISFPTYWPRKGFEQLLDFLSKPFFKRCLKEADAIIVQTKNTQKLVKSIIPSKSVTIIPPAVDTNTFKIIDSPTDKLEILSVGNLLPQKGTEYLIRAIPYVKKDFQDIVLRIVGTGPYEQYLRKLSISLNLSHNVVFEGYVTREKLVKLYNKATVFCSPSLVEPFGVVMLEAMACGKPIVATKTEGATEIIQNGKEGFLVDIGNPKSIADALLTLLHNHDLTKSMGRNAREKCLKKYSWSVVAKIYSRVYSSILGR